MSSARIEARYFAEAATTQRPLEGYRIALSKPDAGDRILAVTRGESLNANPIRRIIYRIDSDAFVSQVYLRRKRKSPRSGLVDACKRRHKDYEAHRDWNVEDER